MRPAFARLARMTTREAQVGGTTIPAGQMLALWVASANRDEDHFPGADRFDLRRNPNRHLGFGQGIHYCLGAPLARLETRIALEHLLDTYEDFDLVPDQPVLLHDPKAMIGAKTIPPQRGPS